jgi:hypothetical protein
MADVVIIDLIRPNLVQRVLTIITHAVTIAVQDKA